MYNTFDKIYDSSLDRDYKKSSLRNKSFETNMNESSTKSYFSTSSLTKTRTSSLNRNSDNLITKRYSSSLDRCGLLKDPATRTLSFDFPETSGSTVFDVTPKKTELNGYPRLTSTSSLNRNLNSSTSQFTSSSHNISSTSSFFNSSSRDQKDKFSSLKHNSTSNDIDFRYVYDQKPDKIYWKHTNNFKSGSYRYTFSRSSNVNPLILSPFSSQMMWAVFVHKSLKPLTKLICFTLEVDS